MPQRKITLNKDGTPRKQRSDAGKKRATVSRTKGYSRKAYTFMKSGGMTAIPVPRYTTTTRKAAKPRARKATTGRANPTKGYSRKAYTFMKSGGMATIPVPNYAKLAAVKTRVARKPSAYNQYVKDNFRVVKAQHPGAKANDIMKMVATRWNSFKSSGFFF
jgi:hypothetical protein